MESGINQERKNNRMTIGYLDENAFTEYHGYMTAGMVEEAKKNDLNLIRFGHFDTHNTERNQPHIRAVLDFVQQYPLDGLIFLGWARAANFENHESFKQRFDSIPLFSLGTGFPEIPHNYFPGDVSIKEILLHLIEAHRFRKIAFIAPYWPDARSDVYRETMSAYGMYDPALYISEKDVAGLDVTQRAKKALSILLDQRGIQVEAIMSCYNSETKSLIEELQARNIQVPGGIAVTSYEDGEIGKFSSPAFTTVYFPYKEMGISACNLMAQLLQGQKIPLANLVPGRIVIRESCGCMPTSVTRSAAGKMASPGRRFGELTQKDRMAIRRVLHKEITCREADTDSLMNAFNKNFFHRETSVFLRELELQLEKINQGNNSAEIEDMVSLLRKILLPFFIPYISKEVQTYLWAENLFQQAQIMLLDKKSGAWAWEEVQSKSTNLVLQEISQKMVDNFSMESLIESLEQNLPALDIPSCYIFIFSNTEDNDNQFEHCTLAFEYRNHQRIKSKKNLPGKAREKLEEILFTEDRPHFFNANLLYAGEEFLGFALFEPGPMDGRIYHTMAIHISTALSGAILLEKLDSSYKRLIDQAHKKGMADIASGILHNVGNILNSINVSIHLIKHLVSTSPIKDIISANLLLEKHMGNIEQFICEHEKGKKLLKFYTKMGEPMLHFKEQLNNNVNRLINNINIIEDIVTAQHSYAGIKSTLEELDVIPIVEDALKMSAASLEKRQICIVKNFESNLPKSMVQKTKLFHVLVNLINNAKEAMMGVPEDKRMLMITISQVNQFKVIRVKDTGHGIPAELLESIFAYGYTTKKGGHGFGLHSCANYMTEMGGKIWAESEGPGKGASFVLQLQH